MTEMLTTTTTAPATGVVNIIVDEQISIPLNLDTLAAFRRWTRSDAFPQHAHINYLGGNIEVDMQAEEFHSHGSVKIELVMILGAIVKQEDRGELFSDRARIASTSASLSCEPDVLFLSHDSISSGKVRFVAKAGHTDRFVEVEGGPDCVIEIVSDSSVNKDTRHLPIAYFTAGVTEYWLVDARGDNLQFQIHRRAAISFEPASADADGYQTSTVFQRSFKLERSRNRHGHWTYDLLDRG